MHARLGIYPRACKGTVGTQSTSSVCEYHLRTARPESRRYCPLARYSRLILALPAVGCVSPDTRVRNPVKVDIRLYYRGVSIHARTTTGHRMEMHIPRGIPTKYLSPEITLYHLVVSKPTDVETLRRPVGFPEPLVGQVDRSRRQVLENTILLTRGGCQAHGIGDNLPRATYGARDWVAMVKIP